MTARAAAGVLLGGAGRQASRRADHGVRGLASASAAREAPAEERCRLLVVGGGTGGCALAARFSRALGPGQVVVLEPADTHYYQPMFTLVGGGVKPLSASRRPMRQVLPARAKWIQDAAAAFRPEEDLVVTAGGRRLRYDYLIVAMGLQLRFEDVPGLREALALPGSGVGSNYSPLHVEKTWAALRELREGKALFTFPNTPIKCAGAPQKILYLADDHLRRAGRRDAVRLHYHTSLADIFGVKHYANALWPIVKERDIHVALRSELVEVKAEQKQAVFRDLDHPERRTTLEYSFLHATPPQGPPDALRECAALADPASGYLAVDRATLRHARFRNVFGVGDCTNVPTSKTAAAVAAQSAVVHAGLAAAMRGRESATSGYDGYTSCPLVTARGRCVLAEFDFDGQPLETFPLDQRRERWTMYQVKATFMPILYWHLMLRGYWGGPRPMRKILHLGMCR
ncbi:hypothetical protein R5R35_012968 [Gryllus longicercus]|uniref:Sulfide:quinone oxidoreductase, mitochondrial n=1 Tax=Gryllus longicercus TaxID=2509291 RepID=A0AAN9ZJ43_9ORTH